MIVSIIGLGFVGSAMEKSFNKKNIKVVVYDKFKNGGIGKFEDCLISEISFLALPTQYNEKEKEYDKKAIYETINLFNQNKYKGGIVIKSTIEPETLNNLSEMYPSLNLIHNPEFLTARTAFEDFHNQKHIVLGKTDFCDIFIYEKIIKFFSKYYPNAKISQCSSLESESMKCFLNSFYAVKVQFFTELYLLCQKNGAEYNKIKEMMIYNGWINPMHTQIPGPDGKISYGGACFPKDTMALLEYTRKINTPNAILENTILERNKMRND